MSDSMQKEDQCLDAKCTAVFSAQNDTSTAHISIANSLEQEITLPSSSQFFTSDGNNVVAFVSSMSQLDNEDVQAVVFSSLPAIQQQLSEGQLENENSSIDSNKVVLQSVNESECKIQNDLVQIEESNVLLQQDSLNQVQQVVTSESDFSVHFKEASMVLTTIQPAPSLSASVIQNNSDSVPIEAKHPKYFCLSNTEEVEEAIRKHTEETFSHFVVAKKTKAYGSAVSSIDVTTKFRIHWQSRDLTTTEECAVQIPFEGVPFIYIGEKAYMCHLGRNKASKHKPAQLTSESSDGKLKRHRSRLTKKQGCPAKIFVKQIAKFPQFRISNNSEYLRTQMSQKLRKALVTNNGDIKHVIQFIGTLPDITEHSNHDIGENTPVREPIDPIIRDKIVELSWEYGENALPRQVKDLLDDYVENELFKGKTTPSKNRRRFYPSEKDISNYIYKSRVLSKLTSNEQEQLSELIQKFQEEHPQEKFGLKVENEDQYEPSSEAVVVEGVNQPSSNVNDNRMVFSYQTQNQQRLLKRYGKQAILTEMSKNSVPFPYYGVFVPTNVDFQLVYSFVVQTRSRQCLIDGMASLLEWNPYWVPKIFVVDFSRDQISAIENHFPACVVLISEISRNHCWNTWLNHPTNIANLVGDKDDVLEKLTDIANSYTEETLNKAAQALENSEVWRLSEDLRDWFSTEWLAEAKRWVVGYRHDEYFPTLHFEVSLIEEVGVMRESHYSYMKNKKLLEFLRNMVEDLVPNCYNRYVSRNILDYRNQYLLTKAADAPPSYLQYKPSTIIKHVMERIRSTVPADYTVNQIQPGVCWVQNKNEPEVTYSMTFGDATTLPSCVCFDWLKYKLPCKHMLIVFHNFRDWGYDMLSSLYTGNPTLNMDISCFDKNQEDVLLNGTTADGNCDAGTPVRIVRSGKHQTMLSIVKPLMSTGAGTLVSGVRTTLDAMNVLTMGNSGKVVSQDGLHFSTNLVSDCDTFCQELSNSIRQVDNQNMLQKVKLDLQLMLNDVKLEIAKVPQLTKTAKRPPTVGSSTDGEKKAKLDTTICSSNVDGSTKADGKVIENQTGVSLPSGNTLLLTVNEEESEVIPMIISQICGVNDQGTVSNETTRDHDVWIFDSELNIKLTKKDQNNILSGRTLSLNIVKSVQDILRHQFDDVDGLYGPDLLAKESVERLNSKKKVLQLHMTDDDHWSASAKIAEAVFIFCCTLSSKATVIEQILKMTAENCLGDNLLFIERVEKEDEISQCGLHAIAYTVAFAFDIEPRNLVFDENGMRSHLAECLEDMCFSMFPLKIS